MKGPSIAPVWAKGVALRDKRRELIRQRAALFPELVEALEEASLELGILLGAYEQPEDDIRTRIESVLAKVKALEVKE